jgi:hypothetical protein
LWVSELHLRHCLEILTVSSPEHMSETETPLSRWIRLRNDRDTRLFARDPRRRSPRLASPICLFHHLPGTTHPKSQCRHDNREMTMSAALPISDARLRDIGSRHAAELNRRGQVRLNEMTLVRGPAPKAMYFSARSFAVTARLQLPAFDRVHSCRFQGSGFQPRTNVGNSATS